MKSLYKILHTTCHTGWGGLEKRIFNESVWMEKNGHQIIIAAPEGTPLYDRAKHHGFKVYPVLFKPLSARKDYRQLCRIIYNEKPWVINTHGNADSKLALFAAKRLDVPLRILSRHISAHVRNSWYNRLLYKKLSHYIFTTADYTTEHLRKTFKLKDMQVFSMPSGIIPPDELTDKDTARQMLIDELGVDSKTRFIGFAGRVSPDKGVSDLIEAFHQISKKYENHHLVILGDGLPQYIDSQNKRVQKHNIEPRVHFAGFKENIYPYYRALDLKVLPSKNIRGVPFEGVPQSILEAMYCRCPVIGSDTGGITDIIDNDTTGLLFESGNVNALSECIINSLENPEETETRVNAAFEKVKKHHTIDVMGRNIIRIYRLHQVKLERSPYEYESFE